PRYRLVIPLTRDISPEEYNAITRYYAAELGIEMFDTCSFTPSQLMFWPTTSSDGEYIFREVEGEALDPDIYLAAHPSWKDPLALPTSSKEAPPHEGKGKVEDPLTKEGIVGTFCRAMGTIQNAIDLYLSDVYEKVRDDRYHLIGSSSGPGVQIYDNKLAYSNHATDLAARQTCNAFDLIRLHKFPDEDPKKSFTAMSEWAASLPEVSRLLLEEKQSAATTAFSEEDDSNWQDRLIRDKHGNLINSLHNLGLIMTYDPYMKNIVFNQLADGMEIKGEVPWAHEGKKFWRDQDDAQLIWYVDQNYGSFSQRNYDIAVTKCVDDRSYHPIKEYLETLPEWDGTPRVDTLLIDYLGAEDNDYVRAVTRKELCAAVTRVYHPGTKFDTLLVLIGEQGIGKSTLIARLAMEWFSDSLTLSDINDGKAGAEKLQGIWIMEIGEMAGMRKAEQEKLKAFFGRQDDKYRAAFGRRVQSHPRQSVMFGTTNAESGFLRDITGNRRYWPVTVLGTGTRKPWELTQDDVNQIWAEVLVLVAKGEPLTLPADLEEQAKVEQNSAMEKDEREGVVRLFLETLLPENWDSMDLYQRREFLRGDDPTQKEGTIRRTSVSNMEIWCECFGRNREDLKPAESYALSSLMSRIEGWSRPKTLQTQALYGKQRVYLRE
ncbi:MAG TPA: virulence-associated E family protein, partial [Spirochaetia bacterium]|nr:virulence-associated E family protein [Spirochaetia bacterium]